MNVEIEAEKEQRSDKLIFGKEAERAIQVMEKKEKDKEARGLEQQKGKWETAWYGVWKKTWIKKGGKENEKQIASGDRKKMHLVKKIERAEKKMNRQWKKYRMNEDREWGKMRGRLIFFYLNLHKTVITTNLDWGGVGGRRLDH